MKRETTISPAVENTTPQANEDFEFVDVIVVCIQNIKVLVFGIAMAGLIALGVSSFLPKTYTSLTYLGPFNESRAKEMEALVHSPMVIDVVLKKYPMPGEDQDVNRKLLEAALRWTLAPGAHRSVASLYTLAVSDNSPARAQAVNIALVDAWLEASKPRSETRERFESRLMRTLIQLKSVSTLIDRLEKESPTLVVPGFYGELASPLATLLEMREKHLSVAEDLKLTLAGASRDLVVVPPSLPTLHAWPSRRLIVAFSMLAAGGALLSFLLLREAMRMANARARSAPKMARLRAGLWPWR